MASRSMVNRFACCLSASIQKRIRTTSCSRRRKRSRSCRAVNHPQVQFLYDLFHEQIAEGNLIEKLEKHIDVIGLVHVADVPGRHQPGTGEINYINIYRKLAELKYRHVVAMEFHPTGDPIATLRAAKQVVSSATGKS